MTALGTQASEVALLVQAKQLTGSPLAVGLLGAVELVPLVLFGLYGGVLADRFDRRPPIRWCEAALGGCAILLLVNALRPAPALWPLFAVTAVMMAAAALQSPSLDASVPPMVPRDQLTAASALLSLSQNASFLLGSALGGVLAVRRAPGWSTGSMRWVSQPRSSYCRELPSLPGTGTGAAALRGSPGGCVTPSAVRTCSAPTWPTSRAMIFAYPNALFPFLAVELHARWATGLMFAAPSVGAFGVTVLSGWMGRISRTAWPSRSRPGVGLAMAGFGLSPDIYVALACLIAAGAADMISGIFRDTLWTRPSRTNCAGGWPGWSC